MLSPGQEFSVLALGTVRARPFFLTPWPPPTRCNPIPTPAMLTTPCTSRHSSVSPWGGRDQQCHQLWITAHSIPRATLSGRPYYFIGQMGKPRHRRRLDGQLQQTTGRSGLLFTGYTQQRAVETHRVRGSWGGRDSLIVKCSSAGSGSLPSY